MDEDKIKEYLKEYLEFKKKVREKTFSVLKELEQKYNTKVDIEEDFMMCEMQGVGKFTCYTTGDDLEYDDIDEESETKITDFVEKYTTKFNNLFSEIEKFWDSKGFDAEFEEYDIVITGFNYTIRGTTFANTLESFYFQTVTRCQDFRYKRS